MPRSPKKPKPTDATAPKDPAIVAPVTPVAAPKKRDAYKWYGFSIPCEMEVADGFADLCRATGFSRAEATRELVRAMLIRPGVFQLAAVLSAQREQTFGDTISDLLTAQLRILRENGELLPLVDNSTSKINEH